jgi:hypothetical protein
MFEISRNVDEDIIEDPEFPYQSTADLEFTCHKIDENVIHFFFCESKNIFHFEYNRKTTKTKPSPQMGEEGQYEYIKKKPANRSWDFISIFSCMIHDHDESLPKIEQFYFVDSHHQIQLLFPNSNLHQVRNQKIAAIRKETGLEELQHLKYKRIYCENQHNDEACHGHNSMVYQSFDDLEKLILDK